MAEHKEVRSVSGTAVPVRGNDIDTDRIIPARYMKVVTFDGLGEFAFRDVRFDEDATQTDHPFNDPRHRNAEVLLVNKNFGCGSSREHAPQALMRWGIKAIVGESFAEIFAGNCNALGVPAVTVSEQAIDELMTCAEAAPDTEIEVDLDAAVVRCGDQAYAVEFPEAYRQSLLSGDWDSTAVLLSNKTAIDKTAASLPYLNGFAS